MRLSLEAVFGLIMGAIFLVIIGFIIWTVVIKPQILEKIDDATLSAFDEIVRVLKDAESGNVADKVVAVNIRRPFVIMGFSPFEDAILEKMEGGLCLNCKYNVWPDDTINNPCDIHKSCLCICPYEEPKVIRGRAGLGTIKRLACSAYGKKCVEFDLPSLKGREDYYGGYLIMTPFSWKDLLGPISTLVPDEPYKVWINGSREDGVKVIADVE